MLVRNLLLAVGALCLLAGVVLALAWYNQAERTPAERLETARPAMLVTTHAVPTGTLLRPEDIGWREVGSGEIQAGHLVRGQVSQGDFVGAIARRNFAQGEPLVASDLVKPSERQFLAAVLKPGNRAVSISVDAPQSAAGLILPGDQVDVILTQSFADPATDPARKSVAETVLRNVRVIAVDQSISTVVKQSILPRGALTPEPRVPKTVTFELSEGQAEKLFVAAQLGHLQLSVRPLEAERAAETGKTPADGRTWASDVSPALKELARKTSGSASTVEKSIRLPPVVSQ
jgi:pilus assembly protein CpaB